MRRRVVSFPAAAGALALCWFVLSGFRANAIEVQCIEDAKYERIYGIFGDDPAKFAAYLEIDTGTHRLPDRSACRAALVRGGIGERSDDRDRLVQFIIRNGGWLAAIYLDSGGGSVAVGHQLGWAVRAFRLKTYVAARERDATFYQPDFGLPQQVSAQPVASARPARCWLKSGTPAERPADTTVSGVIRPNDLTPTYEQNTDRVGRDFRTFNLAGPNPRLCQQRCIQEHRCRAWTYVAPERSPSRQPVCWLKDAVPVAEKGENIVSGVVTRLETFQPTYEEGVDRPGQDYRRFDLRSPNPRLCQQSCQQDQQCRAWTYERPGASALVALMSGWRAYQSSASALAPGSCASACTFLHVAGIDRHGVSHFHRARLGYSELSADANVLLSGERAVIAFYNYMDAGPDVARTYQSTSSTELTPLQVTRSPRYVTDYLINKCGADPEKLETIERLLGENLQEFSRAGFGLRLPADHVAAGWASLHERRQAIEQCVAREEERDRLKAFDSLCGKGCEPSKLIAAMDADLKKAIDPK